MKVLFLSLAVLFALASTAVVAGNGNGNANGHDKGNDGNAGGNGNGNAGGNGKGNGDGDGDGHSETSPGVVVYSPEGLVTIGTEQNIALDAVKSGEALPLDQIEPVAIRQWGGRLIDAHLLRLNGTLLYRLTMVSDAGASRRVYYNARTGVSVVVR